jgi:hypothetical protein
MEFLTQQPITPELQQSDSLRVMFAYLLQKIHRGPKFQSMHERNGFSIIHDSLQVLKSYSSEAIPISRLESILNDVQQFFCASSGACAVPQ